MVRCVVSKELTVTDRNAADILTLMQRGFSIRWLETTDKPAVSQRARRRRRRAPNVSPVQLQEMVVLRKKGLSHRIIARRYKMSMSGARNAIIRAGKAGNS